ncbi:MAG: nucleotide exchange factor GrpE [Candidatus Parcubacteria bacterium]|nr:nucleotide exchange factor GrpE [Candidatus Parcubacteria bacterium]
MNEEEIVFEEENGEGEAINPAETIKKLREKLKKCGLEKQDYLAGWQRAKADSVNTRKEEEENRREFIKFSELNLILELLVLADSFDALFKYGKKDEGVENIYKQLLDILKSRGVEIIKAEGKVFNPEEHESVGEIPVDSKEKENIIMEEIRRGYKMRGRIIRPTQVKIGKYV